MPSNPRHRQSAFGLTGILGSFLWVMVWTLPVAAHSIEVGVGFHTNFDSDHRNVYGAATALSLGYSAPLTPKNVRLMVEVAYLSASGDEFPTDPFFQRSDASYWVLPLIVGLRTNFVPSQDRQTVAFYGGIGFASMLSGFKDPNGTTYGSPLIGGFIEVRPEFRVSKSLAVWVRQRILVTSSVDYGLVVRDLNYSGATFQVGLMYTVQ